LKLTTDRHEPTRGLSATAELLVDSIKTRELGSIAANWSPKPT